MRISDWSSDVCSSDLSDMFRDPEVFACLRRDVFPVLASYPHINIWQAGCAHGEEIYSLAILLTEAGRSEEHTSELQSLMRISYAVFCLKKQNYTYNTTKLQLYSSIVNS